ncbi:MAG: hypothetical protein U0U46_16560 [Saprospiraceae bacterium]|nr:hypothetical protein [Saprospiraceae bacterium]
MQELLKKMNYKGQNPVLVLESPDDFALNLANALPDISVLTDPAGQEKTEFALAFVTRQAHIEALVPLLNARLEGDGLLWLAYPKGTSKRYKCDFNRDNGWQVLGKLGFEPVRQVAIDEDWSALRFRRVEFIKTMTRSFAMSEKGKQKTGK